MNTCFISLISLFITKYSLTNCPPESWLLEKEINRQAYFYLYLWVIFSRFLKNPFKFCTAWQTNVKFKLTWHFLLFHCILKSKYEKKNTFSVLLLWAVVVVAVAVLYFILYYLLILFLYIFPFMNFGWKENI